MKMCSESPLMFNARTWFDAEIAPATTSAKGEGKNSFRPYAKEMSSIPRGQVTKTI